MHLDPSVQSLEVQVEAEELEPEAELDFGKEEQQDDSARHWQDSDFVHHYSCQRTTLLGGLQPASWDLDLRHQELGDCHSDRLRNYSD